MVGKLEERPHRYVSRVEIGKLVKDAQKELANERKPEFVVFVLSLFSGLRRGEIDRLTWEQVDFEGGHIWIKTIPYFRPKARNSESRVDCPKEVFEVLSEFKQECGKGPFVPPGGDAKSQVRCRPLFRALTEWMQSKGIKEQKPLHTLRKEAGSSIFLLTGSADRDAEFLRNDPKTARVYYLGRKGRLEVRIEGL